MKTKSIILLNTVNVATALAAFDSGKAGWKMSADGKTVELKDGNPVYIDSNGAEMTVGGDTISRLNNESKQHRERAENAEKALRKFEGIDADKARSAIDTVGKIDQKKLIDAGEVDKVRQEIGAQYTAQLGEKDKEIDRLKNGNDTLIKQNAFNSSDFIRNRIAVPPEMFIATFDKNFKVEDGKISAYGADGNRVYSAKRAGEYADMEEALQIIVDNYPHKATILKADGHSGSGNNGGGGGHGGKRTVSRSELDKMSPADQAATALKANKGEVILTD